MQQLFTQFNEPLRGSNKNEVTRRKTNITVGSVRASTLTVLTVKCPETSQLPGLFCSTDHIDIWYIGHILDILVSEGCEGHVRCRRYKGAYEECCVMSVKQEKGRKSSRVLPKECNASQLVWSAGAYMTGMSARVLLNPSVNPLV